MTDVLGLKLDALPMNTLLFSYEESEQGLPVEIAHDSASQFMIIM